MECWTGKFLRKADSARRGLDAGLIVVSQSTGRDIPKDDGAEAIPINSELVAT